MDILNDDLNWLKVNNLGQEFFQNLEELKKAYCIHLTHLKMVENVSLGYKESSEIFLAYNAYEKNLFGHFYNLITIKKDLSLEDYQQDFIKNSNFTEPILRTYFNNIESKLKKLRNGELSEIEIGILKDCSLGLETFTVNDKNIAYFCPGCNLIYANSPKFKKENIKLQPGCLTLEARCNQDHLLYKKMSDNHKNLEYVF